MPDRSPWQARLLAALTFVAGLIVCAIGLAADPLWLEQAHRLGQPLLKSRCVVGWSVAWVDAGHVWYAGYGTVGQLSSDGQASSDGAASDARKPDERTVYEIGSITKVFTSLLLAVMVEQGQVQLDEPIQHLLPDRKLPHGKQRPITLVDLATHSSGLPRMPKNFHPADPRNPYADYTLDQLFEFLAHYRLRKQPGERYAYSNLGIGLLGVALAKRAGKSYEELVVETICDPLALHDTRITLNNDQRRRLAAGHDADGQPYPNWDIPALAGAGALRSTVADLARFLQANLGTLSTPLDKAIRLTHQPRFEIGPKQGSVALGWHVSADGKRLQHSGQTGGYHSFIAMHRERPLGVVVLANSATGWIDRLGNQYFRLLAGESVEPLQPPVPIELPPEVLQRYVGQYRLAPLAVFDITLKDGHLWARLTGQDALRIYPTSETEFFYRIVDARLTFVVDDHGKVRRLILHQHGRDMPAEKEK